MTQEPDATVPRARAVHPALAFGIGALSALVGLAPWLGTGARMPLQNLWATDTMPDEMPLVLLPLSNYQAVSAAALLVIGAAIAGTVVAIVRARGLAMSASATLAGLLVVQLAALAQSALALAGGLGDEDRARLYLWVLIAAALLAMGLGVLALLGIASRRPVPSTLAIAAAAVALGTWLSEALVVVMPGGTGGPVIVWQFAEWLPAVVTGIAVGWCGVRTVGRTLASLAALALIWVGPAALVALFYGLGSRIYLQNPEELVPAMKQAFQMALGSAGQGPQRLAITLSAAVISWLAFAAWSRTRTAPEGAPTVSADAP